MTRLSLLLATVVLGAASPGVAAPPPDEFTPCSFASTADPTGVVEPDPDRQYAEIEGGPVVVTLDELVVNTTITCSLQVDADDAAAPDEVSISAMGSGPTAYLPPTLMTFRAAPGDHLFVCTAVTWQTRDSVQTWVYDADPARPGDQCDQRRRV